MDRNLLYVITIYHTTSTFTLLLFTYMLHNHNNIYPIIHYTNQPIHVRPQIKMFTSHGSIAFPSRECFSITLMIQDPEWLPGIIQCWNSHPYFVSGWFKRCKCIISGNFGSLEHHEVHWFGLVSDNSDPCKETEVAKPKFTTDGDWTWWEWWEKLSFTDGFIVAYLCKIAGV